MKNVKVEGRIKNDDGTLQITGKGTYQEDSKFLSFQDATTKYEIDLSNQSLKKIEETSELLLYFEKECTKEGTYTLKELAKTVTIPIYTVEWKSSENTLELIYVIPQNKDSITTFQCTFQWKEI